MRGVRGDSEDQQVGYAPHLLEDTVVLDVEVRFQFLPERILIEVPAVNTFRVAVDLHRKETELAAIVDAEEIVRDEMLSFHREHHRVRGTLRLFRAFLMREDLLPVDVADVRIGSAS